MRAPLSAASCFDWLSDPDSFPIRRRAFQGNPSAPAPLPSVSALPEDRRAGPPPAARLVVPDFWPVSPLQEFHVHVSCRFWQLPPGVGSDRSVRAEDSRVGNGE